MEYLMGLWGRGRPRIPASPEDLQRLVDLYDGEIAYLDSELGRLLARLDEPDLRDRAIVAVTADHGESLTEHGYLFDHGVHLYQPSLHVPLMLRLPGAPPAAGSLRIAAPVQTHDLFPTLLEAAGLDVPTSTEGRSLLPLLHGDAEPLRTLSFAEACRPWEWEAKGGAGYRNLPKAQVAMRWPWKLVVTPHEQKIELYDLEADPGELSNRVADEPQRTAALYHALREWRKGALPAGGPPDPENLEQLRALGYVE